jgi:hypothetical protein
VRAADTRFTFIATRMPTAYLVLPADYADWRASLQQRIAGAQQRGKAFGKVDRVSPPDRYLLPNSSV